MDEYRNRPIDFAGNLIAAAGGFLDGSIAFLVKNEPFALTRQYKSECIVDWHLKLQGKEENLGERCF
jgi:hypothetical protein